MKKLSLIVAMVLVATIGGVYATWSYPSENATGLSREVSVSIEGAAEGGVKGALAIVASDDFAIKVVNSYDIPAGQQGHSTTKYLAALHGTGTLTLTLNPADGAQIPAEGIPLQFVISVNGTRIEYDGRYMFADVSSEPADISNIANDEQQNIKPGGTIVIQAANLIGDGKINLTTQDNEGFILDTIEKHTAFENALKSNATAQFKITFSEKQVEESTPES